MKKLLAVAIIAMFATTAQAGWWDDLFNGDDISLTAKAPHCPVPANSACGMIDGKCVDARCKDAKGNAVPGCTHTQEMVVCPKIPEELTEE